MGQIYGTGSALGHIWVRSMGQQLLWGRCGSDLWGRSCCGADVGQIYGAGALVGLMRVRPLRLELIWVRSVCQELMWVRSMGQKLLCCR